MSQQQIVYKKLDEMVFDDLYVDETDELYPHIRKALGRMKTRLQRREQRFTQAVNWAKEDFAYSHHTVATRRLKHHSI